MLGSPRTFYKLTTLSENQAYLAQLWDILQASYQQVLSGLHYSKPQDALNKTDGWHLIVKNDQVLINTHNTNMALNWLLWLNRD
ncbi:hypothetical protein [Vibrio cincinnatiensis]|uniref:hypothetical protein n=1 Tax=Vibrio cincinnatiensis TaxID=675 RepID=UPI001EDFC66A|nr:hypothetical protein [Vibrio cincinnatiensis]MCG3734517.1 hypothetical protein [Vibrio cincinnatiensis]MCG3741624.1 hypothetical protein [Vibrio cincinnatiensis]MCG3744805.1 hypothetical protein [Vibrio cincinnatiensis]